MRGGLRSKHEADVPRAFGAPYREGTVLITLYTGSHFIWQLTYEVGTIIMYDLQIKKLNHREGK